MSEWSNKVKEHFIDVTLNKAVVDKIGLRDKPIPSYVVDWLVSRYSNEDEIDINALNAFMEKYLPDKNRREEIKHRIKEGERVKLLDALKVIVDLTKGEDIAILSSLSLGKLKIPPAIVKVNPVLLYGDTWGHIELSYKISEETNRGEVWVEKFKIMQTGEIDFDYFIKQRKYFTLEEWIDMLTASMGYNPDYYTFKQKTYILLRLVPMVQPHVNIIELAPKGTGKSTVFSKLSRYVWLISGGVVTRAQLFYNMKDKTEGIIAFYDVVVLDEVQTIKFTEPGEIIGALKGYLESSEYRVMGHRGTAEAGFVILANIQIGSDGFPVNKFILQELPEFLQETAFIDRFHGIIPGWRIPRVEKKSLISRGYVLRSDYFYEVLHLLRRKTEYSDFVKKHLYSTGDVRDVRAVEQISTGLLKLFYPDLNLSIENFEKFCVDKGKELRQLVREQMAIKDREYKWEIANIQVN